MNQRCTKCGIREAVPKFTIDKETAYCAECADLLRLGTSKEAQKMEQGIPRSEVSDQEEESDRETDETI